MQKTLSGLKWSLLGRVGHQLLSFGFSIALARLVIPEDFGLFGMLLVIVGFAQHLAESGMTMALVQRSDLKEEHRSTGMWLSAGIALVVGALMFFGADAIAAFYERPSLVLLAQVMALNFPIRALEIVPRAVLQREMAFAPLARVEITATVLPGILGVVLALNDFGVWALVAQLLGRNLLQTALLWRASGWWPRAGFQWRAAREILSYSLGLLGFTLVNYWTRNLDELLIGKNFGAYELGIYQRAYLLMQLPLQQISTVVSRVIFPALSAIKDDLARFKRVFLRAVSLMSFIGLPAMAGLVACAEPFVLTLYGEGWSDVIPILQVLGLANFVNVICHPVGWIYVSQGRTALFFWWSLGVGALYVTSIAIGVSFGTPIAVAYAHLIASIIQCLPCIYIPGRLIGMSVSELLRVCSGSFFCAILMGGTVYLVGDLMPGDWAPGIKLFLLVSLGCFIYWLLVHTLGLAAYKDAKKLLAEQWARRRAKETELKVDSD